MIAKFKSIVDNAEKDLDIPLLKLLERREVRDIPRRLPLVYVLFHGDRPLVVGEGKYERAKVIFDGSNQVTWGHIKSFMVRLYSIYGDDEFTRYTITCQCKGDAQKLEGALHDQIGGNENRIPAEFMSRLTRNLPDGLARLLRAASLSAFSGLRDLRVWHNNGLIDVSEWIVLCDLLKLPLHPVSDVELHS